MKKQAENPIYELSAFCGGSGTWIPCPCCHALIPCRYKLVVRRSYQEDFQRAAAKAGLPPEFIPHSLRHLYASTALAEGIPITEVSRWLGHKNIEVTHQIYGHLVASSFDRARTALDAAYLKSQKQWRPGN
jgi:integrase